jgi:hypothetical protein
LSSRLSVGDGISADFRASFGGLASSDCAAALSSDGSVSLPSCSRGLGDEGVLIGAVAGTSGAITAVGLAVGGARPSLL